jgi:hypothetical protein
MSFLLAAFAIRVEFLVGRAEGCCGLVGRTTPLNRTRPDPLATVVARFLVAWGGSMSISIASIWPIASGPVVE